MHGSDATRLKYAKELKEKKKGNVRNAGNGRGVV
jgi:hypothetical protein